jgi:beta-glucosidase
MKAIDKRIAGSSAWLTFPRLHLILIRLMSAARWNRRTLYISACWPMILITVFAQTPAPVVTGDRKVDQLLSKMTLQEKITLLHGTDEDPATFQGQAGYMPGLPRLGIPSLRLADGPPGILTRVPSIAPTATMGLAATFSLDDARKNGTLIGREASSHGMDVALQPFINIDRDIAFARGYNTFGEDPFLTGQIGAAEIRGIQGQGVLAEAKHYIGYDTGARNVFIDQQTLHEVYAAPFADAVDAGVASLMCSYNKINGQYACGNRDTLTGILRDELKFRGFVTSDWGANHATDFINAGLDLEMPGTLKGGRASYFAIGPQLPASAPGDKTDEPGPIWLPEEPAGQLRKGHHDQQSTTDLMSEIHSGEVTEATVTRAAGRILYEMDRFGLLSGKSKHTITPSDVKGNALIVRKTSDDAAVLLKNKNHALPLTHADFGSLAIIGPGGGQVLAVGHAGEKAVGLPEREIGPVAALLSEIGYDPSAHIRYAPADDLTGVPVPANLLSYENSPGLERTTASGTPIQRDAQLNYTRSNGRALPPNSSTRWKGALHVPETGTYRLHLQVLGAFASLRIDGRQVDENSRMFIHGDITQPGESDIAPTIDGLDNLRVALPLTAGPHEISVSETPDTSNAPVQIRLNWVTPQQQKTNYDKALAAARESKKAIVFVWSRGTPVFGLPGDQDNLVRDVLAVNPNTVVVLNVSQPVSLPWINDVRGVLQMWYPGDEGGWATADVLLGRVNPAGRLPFTWPMHLEDEPAQAPGHPERTAEGLDGKTIFSEGIFEGYRWFDHQNIQPLFPFGFGLSYTTFQYSDLRVEATADRGANVAFTLKNTGPVSGDEVLQIYVGAPQPKPAEAQFAVRTLAAFDRIHLNAGQSRRITVHIRPRSFEYWSAQAHAWLTAHGERIISVGASSRDLRLNATIHMGSDEKQKVVSADTTTSPL